MNFLPFFHVFLLLAISANTMAQDIRLDYQNVPLNDVLIDLNNRYNVQVSVDSKLAGNCNISISENFTSMQSVMMALAKPCSLELNQIGEIYTFTKAPEDVNVTPVTYLFQGQIVDQTSQEPLPFTKIIINNTRLIADENGNFSCKSESKTTRGQFRHLGYGLLDTLVDAGHRLIINLTPRPNELETVIVQNIDPVYTNASGDVVGHLKLNDVSTTLIPGNSSNMMFNNIRLYPGVLAAGESLSEYLMWGSYLGQNQIIYDGITLFSGSGIDDNIGRVNPLMIKNIEVYKGAYNVDVGDRVGGITLIDAKQGGDSLVGTLSINNQLANAYLNFPLFNRTSSLQIAGRKSYSDLFQTKDRLFFDDRFIQPKYNYSDINLKWSTSFKNGDLLQFNTIFSSDVYIENFSRKKQAEYQRNIYMRGTQLGNSLHYGHNWRKGGISRIELTQSRYGRTFSSGQSFKENGASQENNTNHKWSNTIEEHAIRLNHAPVRNHNQQIDLSLGFIGNSYNFGLDSNFVPLKDAEAMINRMSFFAKDAIQLSPRLNVQFGLKIDMALSTLKPYFQPRVTGQYDINEKWKTNFGWGIYNQFVSQIMLIDTFGTISHIWQITDDKDLPVVSAQHSALGISYLTHGFEFGIEGYFKKTNDMSRYVSDSLGTALVTGNARAYGTDVFVKKRFKGHEIWAAYSLSRLEESFDGTENYVPALQNQMHEIKLSSTFNFSPFFVSLTNIYGSGFNFDEKGNTPYNRLDLAFEYQFNLKQMKFETGLSILNVLNKKNVLLYQFARFPDGELNAALGTSFTPILYINWHF